MKLKGNDMKLIKSIESNRITFFIDLNIQGVLEKKKEPK